MARLKKWSAAGAYIAVGFVLGLSAMAITGPKIANELATRGWSDWLGFWGGIIGAAATVCAGWLAWRAVADQRREERERRASDNLKNYIVTIQSIMTEYSAATATASSIETRSERFGELMRLCTSPQVTLIFLDGDLGDDRRAFQWWINRVMETGAPRGGGGREHAIGIMHVISQCISLGFAHRLRLIEAGSGVDQVAARSFIEIDRLKAAYNSGDMSISGIEMPDFA